MFLAIVLLIPAICSNKEYDAVFKSTPTLFTESSTTPSNTPSNFFWFKSCWYWPTPILLGSIFTSSAYGSCSLLAIDMAPLKDTFMSGCSSFASSDAE